MTLNRLKIDGEINEKHALQIYINNCGPGYSVSEASSVVMLSVCEASRAVMLRVCEASRAVMLSVCEAIALLCLVSARPAVL